MASHSRCQLPHWSLLSNSHTRPCSHSNEGDTRLCSSQFPCSPNRGLSPPIYFHLQRLELRELQNSLQGVVSLAFSDEVRQAEKLRNLPCRGLK